MGLIHFTLRWLLIILPVFAVLSWVFWFISDNISFHAPIIYTKCTIPHLEVFSPSINQYIHKVEPLICSLIPPLVISNVTHLIIQQDVNETYGIEIEDLICSYQPFWRRTPKAFEPDNVHEESNITYYFNSTIKVNDEFVRVICKVNNEVIYKDFHYFVPLIKTNIKIKPEKVKDDKSLNVIIIGIDSVSRINFHRQMPKTVGFLLHKLQAIEYMGYNKVGYNTFPNLIPMLTGHSVAELKSICWANRTDRFDSCPFLWKNFHAQGYYTAFAEDASHDGVFRYGKRGFRNQPTDYYWQVGSQVAEKEISHEQRINIKLCVGPRPSYQCMLDYTLKFVTVMKSQKYFGLFWQSSLTHDDFNFPSLGDQNYAQFFEDLQKTKVLNESILIVMSDHGLRWGKFLQTYQGHLESRLPFIYFVLPEWFKKQFSSATDNLKRNSKRLTTPFDVHETLRDILNINDIRDSTIVFREKEPIKRGISLFLQVPESRTCTSAGIAIHYCTCYPSVKVKVTDKIVSKIAIFTVTYINNLLKNNKCAVLELDNIKYARLVKSGQYLKDNTDFYTITFQVKPSGGIFEATVTCMDCNDEETYRVSGQIDRFNIYGNQSSCIADAYLKLYCYCIH